MRLDGQKHQRQTSHGPTPVNALTAFTFRLRREHATPWLQRRLSTATPTSLTSRYRQPGSARPSPERSTNSSFYTMSTEQLQIAEDLKILVLQRAFARQAFDRVWAKQTFDQVAQLVAVNHALLRPVTNSTSANTTTAQSNQRLTESGFACSMRRRGCE